MADKMVAYDGALCPAAASMVQTARSMVFTDAGWSGVASMCLAVLIRTLMAEGRASEEDVIAGFSSAIANVMPGMTSEQADHLGEEVAVELARQLREMKSFPQGYGHA